MAGQSWPFRLVPNGQGGYRSTLREAIWSSIHVPAEMATQVGVVNLQFRALSKGHPVTLPTPQLKAIFHADNPGVPWPPHPSLPATLGELEEHDAWVLTDDDVLLPSA